MNFIDYDHPFFLVIGGIVAFFAIKYSLAVSKKGTKITNFKQFRADQLDEFIVTIIISLVFVIFDDEILLLYYQFAKGYTPLKIKGMEIEFANQYYLLFGVAVDRLYWVVSKLRH